MGQLKQIFGYFIAAILATGYLSGQVNAPKQRDDVIAAAEAFLKLRHATVAQDENALDPFLGNIPRNVPVPEEPARIELAPVEVEGADLLRRLALTINASGTAIMGENRFLLTARQRILVGDKFFINFNGRDYEVSLFEVTGTTFTIKRNGQVYTRAVKL